MARSAHQEGNTRERIARAAGRLFAQRGFEAVSIRDICREVDIREGTVYYHYANKQAILDFLMAEIDQLIEEKRRAFDQAFLMARQVSVPDMQMVAVHLLKDYLLHPRVHPVIQMLSLERRTNEEAEQRYRRIVFELPLHQQEKVFRQMMERGMILPVDPAPLARLYYGVIYGAYARFCQGETPREEDIAAACQCIREDMAFFCALNFPH